jgi:hypothetical protein
VIATSLSVIPCWSLCPSERSNVFVQSIAMAFCDVVSPSMSVSGLTPDASIAGLLFLYRPEDAGWVVVELHL